MARKKFFPVEFIMIRLYDLIFEDENQPYDTSGGKNRQNRSVWQTDLHKWGAKNSFGQVRYFTGKNPGEARKKAAEFARGTKEGPRVGRAEPKQDAKPVNKVQKYFNNPT